MSTKTYAFFVAIAMSAAVASLPAHAATFTDFESFTTGVSVDGQGGWAASGSWDEEVIDFSGNKVWRVSNAVTAQSFGNMPFSPRPGGVVADTTTDPDNSMPSEFAGESSTGAANNQFVAGFKFRSATGAQQPGASVTISADNGSGGRQSFIDLEESSLAGSGLDIISYDVATNGDFVALPPIAAALSYTDWHDFRVEVDFIDGPDNDIARYYVNDTLVHTGTSWEQYYTNNEPANHPLGVPVQSLLFRISGGAVPGVSGGGFLFDDVYSSVSVIPEPASLMLFGLAGLFGLRSRRR